jgi:hypothetical protein
VDFSVEAAEKLHMDTVHIQPKAPIPVNKALVANRAWIAADAATLGWSLFRSDRIGTEAPFPYFDAFSSREPVPTSLENALAGHRRDLRRPIHRAEISWVHGSQAK